MSTDSKAYKTTFSDGFNVELPEFVSFDDIKKIVKAVQKRSRDTITFEVNSGDYVTRLDIAEIEHFFEDSYSNKQKIISINIESGIVYLDETKTDLHLISADINTSDKRQYIRFHVYGVVDKRESAQGLIDWGRGTSSEFKELGELFGEPKSGSLVLHKGLIIKHQMSVKSKTSTASSAKKWAKDWLAPASILTALAIIVAIIIWLHPIR